MYQRWKVRLHCRGEPRQCNLTFQRWYSVSVSKSNGSIYMLSRQPDPGYVCEIIIEFRPKYKTL